MLKFTLSKDPKTDETLLHTPISGKELLNIPQLNKGTAFSEQERHEFGLLGKLPYRVETLEEQSMRCYLQYSNFSSDLQKNIYLRALHQTNETLFYKLVGDHKKEMIPILYTPIVGSAVQTYSLEYRKPRGLYICYTDREFMNDIIANRSHPDVDVIVVTDGEGVLGIGDQGLGAIDIPIAKLMVYTIAAGINPMRTLPIMLDVGTNNQKLLDDPMYLGWRHKRIEGSEYNEFIAQFVETLKEHFPKAFLHWEDFGSVNARFNLDTYRQTMCSFNDDIQGTGVITLAALLAAIITSGIDIKEQRIVVFGAGSAGIGITQQICDAMIRSGLSEEDARQHFWLLARAGLITDKLVNLSESRKPFARADNEQDDWQLEDDSFIGLLDVIRNVKPTVLIGCSTQGGAFTEEMVREMAKHVDRPIIFPLSNPTQLSEAKPKDLIEWTDGKALIATGSPFDPVEYEGRSIQIGQCNNALVFPGIGLGVTAVQAKELTDDMLWAACRVAAENAPVHTDPLGPLLPAFENAGDYSYKIAVAVAQQAIESGLAQVKSKDSVEELITAIIWEPKYKPYRKT